MFWFTRKKLVGSYFFFDGGQAVVVVAVGGANALLALFHQVIDVGAL